MIEYVMTLRCPDAPGIVHAVAAGLLEAEANILEQAQFTDPDLGLFCLRTRFETASSSTFAVRAALTTATVRFDSVITLRKVDELPRILLMVSKIDHCLVDLLYRRNRGELPIEIPAVVSNHADLRDVVTQAGLPFVHIAVTPDTKAEAEMRLQTLVVQQSVDAVVLARYMQVLSDDLCQQLAGRVINIHHSFLPGFKGARPYHQAHDRGVKLIGATAHFVTGDLDEGPIIEQDVRRVSHAHTADDLVEIGRDVERQVLSRAVRLYAEDRILLTGNRTVIFA